MCVCVQWTTEVASIAVMAICYSISAVTCWWGLTDQFSLIAGWQKSLTSLNMVVMRVDPSRLVSVDTCFPSSSVKYSPAPMLKLKAGRVSRKLQRRFIYLCEHVVTDLQLVIVDIRILLASCLMCEKQRSTWYTLFAHVPRCGDYRLILILPCMLCDGRLQSW